MKFDWTDCQTGCAQWLRRRGRGCLTVVLAVCLLVACSGTVRQPPVRSSLRPIQITHISHQAGSQELMLRAMSLIGTPYRFGGSTRENGFDCSGMVQFVYRDALHVALPRTARDIAAVSRPIGRSQLQVGDLVFFNTGGSPYSHMGLYIGNGRFIHAPSSNGVIRTASLDQAYFRDRFTGARTLFAR